VDDNVAIRERVLNAATTLIANEGLQVSMATIAEVAQVSVGSIYHYFESKDDLVVAASTRRNAMFLDSVIGSLNSNASFEDRLEQYISAYVDFVWEDPVRARFFGVMTYAPETLLKALDDAQREFIERSSALMLEGLDPDSAHVLPAGFVGSFLRGAIRNLHWRLTRGKRELTPAMRELIIRMSLAAYRSLMPEGARAPHLREPKAAASPAIPQSRPLGQSIAPFSLPGRFLRGGLHTHTNRSDGRESPQYVVSAYQSAGYDFLALTDHFLARYDFPITAPEPLSTDNFTVLAGAELHAPRTEFSDLWHIVGVGLPTDFAPPAADEDGPALARRARAAGAFVGIAHPGAMSLSLDDAEKLVGIADAVEIYNHGNEIARGKGSGAYLLDGLMDRGHRLLAYACDDAHDTIYGHGAGWIELKARSNSATDILAALKAGHFYSTQGPRIDDIILTADTIEVRCSPASAIMAVGKGSKISGKSGRSITRAQFPIGALAESPWLRISVIDANGRSAWSNPIWKSPA